MTSHVAVPASRFGIAFQETFLWAKTKLLVSFLATIVVRASTQRFGKSSMKWTEIGLDLLIVIACYLGVLALSFLWNLILAPARLKREDKRKAGLASLDDILAQKADGSVKALEKLMDADDEGTGH